MYSYFINTYKRILFLFGIFFFAINIFNPVAFATNPAKNENDAKATSASATQSNAGMKAIPTKVTSDKMRYDSVKQQVVFSGNVKVTRPDFTLTSATLTVHLSGAQTAGNEKQNTGSFGLDAGKIEKLVAEKNVHITMEQNRSGRCEKATYTLSDAKIVMEGNPILSEGENNVKGERIIFYTRENRSDVIGGVDIDFTTYEKDSSKGLPARK